MCSNSLGIFGLERMDICHLLLFSSLVHCRIFPSLSSALFYGCTLSFNFRSSNTGVSLTTDHHTDFLPAGQRSVGKRRRVSVHILVSFLHVKMSRGSVLPLSADRLG